MTHAPVAPRFTLISLATLFFSQLTACSCSGRSDSPATGGAAPAAGGNIGSAGSAARAVSGSSGSGSNATTGAGGASAGAGPSGGAGGIATGGNAGAGGASGGGTSGSAGAAGAAGSAPIDHNAPGVIVVLGSSTSAGTGPTNPQNAWVERYRAYLKTEFPKFQLTNLAVGGYTTYQMQPSDYTPGGNLPLPDKNHNITMALSLKPNAIVINMPSNDTNANYPASDQMANFDRVTKLAGQAGVLCWVTTTQPRNFTGDADAVQQTKRALLITVRDAIKQKYGDHTLDFWTQFAEADGKIKDMYGAGDGTHLNDAAHALLAQTVENAKIPEAVLSSKP
jgi:lysophospholipase L1-like esterase